jgi:hypothetical protein
MSRQTVAVAAQYGSELPQFANIAQAQTALFAHRDATLTAITSELGSTLALDQSPESLQRVERWYCENASPELGKSGFSVPHAMGYYFGAVLCQHAGFAWCVQEFAFSSGRYGIGVERSFATIMLTKGLRPPSSGNKRMQTLWRDYVKYAA